MAQPPRFVRAILDPGEDGQDPELEIAGRVFRPNPGETDDQLCNRAMRETGNEDANLIVHVIVDV